ncbi:MAG: antitoxin [Lachnospiraceae bacterium]|nr:antitoxin [Lachnospiraceae bacterium]
MKTISIRLEDSIYEELDAMLNAMGQTKQTFYETFTRTALQERCIPFSVKTPLEYTTLNSEKKLAAFKRLEIFRKKTANPINYNTEREEAMNAKYGIVD